MNPEIEQLKKDIEELKRTVDALRSSTTIPLEVDAAFRKRFGIKDFSKLSTSTKSATSENQAVNEAGAASYSVLKAPDGFDERLDGSTVKYYPYFT